MKYILVTGGVISGIGKGVIASSIGTLLEACKVRVTSIKIDPYINIDAGTFSPYEHGKCIPDPFILYISLMSSVCQWSGRPGFNPRSSYTKDSKNGT